MTRRDDPEWADEVIRRWQRRRDLPFRQLSKAWNDLLEDLFLPTVIRLDAFLRRFGRKP